MGRFEVLTKYIPRIKSDSIGEWIIDQTSDGTAEHPIRMPYINYTELVGRFIDDVYRFEENNKDLEMTRYDDILKENGLQWDVQSMENADVFNLNAKCVLALIMGAVRADRFYEGALSGFFRSGAMLRWLERLHTIE